MSKIPVESDKQKSTIITLKEIDTLQRMEEDVRRQLSRKGFVAKYRFSDIHTVSPAVETRIVKAIKFARTDKNILLTGESGTGKELFAHAIHRNSLRADGPFVAVNFAGISESLMESELFGYAEGAFTGAKKGGKTGLFEQAHGGTIFLDEIGDASLSVQSRLLRVLQEREVMRVGDSKIVPIDVRVISATNADLVQAIEEGRFRKDLYYRLCTLPLTIPPLRDRPGDILHIFQRYIKKTYKIQKPMAPDAVDGLTAYDWPGNIRELINVAEYAFISSKGEAGMRLEHLPDTVVRPFGRGELSDPQGLAGKGKSLQRKLEGQGLNRDLLLAMLGVLSERSGQPTGRNSLCRALADGGIAVSEGRMKTLLKHLRRFGLIQVGATKQGTALSESGRVLFETLRADR